MDTGVLIRLLSVVSVVQKVTRGGCDLGLCGQLPGRVLWRNKRLSSCPEAKDQRKMEALKREERTADENEPQGNVQMAKSRAATAAKTALKSKVARPYDIMMVCQVNAEHSQRTLKPTSKNRVRPKQSEDKYKGLGLGLWHQKIASLLWRNCALIIILECLLCVEDVTYIIKTIRQIILFSLYE